MQRQDFVLRLIEELGAFFRQVTQLRQTRSTDEALIALLRAQETLMGRSAAQFAGLSVDQQFELLLAGETPARASEKVATYAALLQTVADVYRDREQIGLAAGAALLADTMDALAAERFPKEAKAARARIAAVRT